MKKTITALAIFLSIVMLTQAQGNYKNFEVAIYSRAYETAKMGDDKWLPAVWDEVSRQVNPKIKVIVKYPNWYDHFQGCGFNLETQPKMFDGVYTGTETRDPSSNQRADYSKGKLYVLTIPDNVVDLYNLPASVTTRIKEILTAKMPVMLDGPGLTSLFVYDNNTAIVESFANIDVQVNLRAGADIQTVKNIQTGEVISGKKMQISQGRNKPALEKEVFELKIKPHSFVALKLQSAN